jgi:hypothetical protein
MTWTIHYARSLRAMIAVSRAARAAQTIEPSLGIFALQPARSIARPLRLVWTGMSRFFSFAVLFAVVRLPIVGFRSDFFRFRS